MKTQTNHSAIVLQLIAFFGITTLNAEKWTAFFVSEKSLWYLIGDFTYSEPVK